MFPEANVSWQELKRPQNILSHIQFQTENTGAEIQFYMHNPMNKFVVHLYLCILDQSPQDAPHKGQFWLQGFDVFIL